MHNMLMFDCINLLYFYIEKPPCHAYPDQGAYNPPQGKELFINHACIWESGCYNCSDYLSIKLNISYSLLECNLGSSNNNESRAPAPHMHALISLYNFAIIRFYCFSADAYPPSYSHTPQPQMPSFQQQPVVQQVQYYPARMCKAGQSDRLYLSISKKQKHKKQSEVCERIERTSSSKFAWIGQVFKRINTTV